MLLAVKHSEFLDLSHSHSPASTNQTLPNFSHQLHPIHLTYHSTHQTWEPVSVPDHSVQASAFHLLQLKLSIPPSTSDALSADLIRRASFTLKQRLTTIKLHQPSLPASAYDDICFRPPQPEASSEDSECFFDFEIRSTHHALLSLAFPLHQSHQSDIHQLWLNRFLTGMPSNLRLVPSALGAASEHGTRQRLGEMRSIRWIAYATRAFIIRFWQLTREADSADIFIMLIAYIVMHLTFLNLFRNMRKLGSRLWLGLPLSLSPAFRSKYSSLSFYPAWILVPEQVL